MLYGGVPYLVGTPLYVLFDYCYRKSFSGINHLILKTTNALNSKMYNVLIMLGGFINKDFNKFSNRYSEKRIPVGITLSLISIIILLLFFISI